MSRAPSKFGSLAQAVRDRTNAAMAADGTGAAGPAAVPGASLHKPAIALGQLAEGLRERISRLEDELASTSGRNTTLESELAHARASAVRAGEAAEEFLFLDPDAVRDDLPRDRLGTAFEGPAFEELLEDIRENGQNDAITVRRMPGADQFEVAAGRRRLEACRRLNRQVLARVRVLDDQAMLRVQFSENERREDISALERARWFAEVKDRLNRPAKEIAGQFGVDPSTLSLYLRLSRFPQEITERLVEPRRLAVLRARRVMEAVQADPAMVGRIVAALDTHARASASRASGVDPDEQLDVLMRTAEKRAATAPGRTGWLSERRHVVHDGRRIGTLTRNGGQWVFRFASSVDDKVVQAVADRIGAIAAEVEKGGR